MADRRERQEVDEEEEDEGGRSTLRRDEEPRRAEQSRAAWAAPPHHTHEHTHRPGSHFLTSTEGGFTLSWPASRSILPIHLISLFPPCTVNLIAQLGPLYIYTACHSHFHYCICIRVVPAGSSLGGPCGGTF